jgi:hypothetical protein
MKEAHKVLRNQRGYGGVAVAIVMAMIVVVSLIQNVVIWGETLTTEEWAQTNEHVSIQAIYFDQGYNLILEVKNVGAVQTHLIAAWVEPIDPLKPIKRYVIDHYVEIQETETVVLLDSGQLLDIFEDCRVTVFTDKGNSAYRKYSYESSPLFDPRVSDLGVFRISWFFSKYSSGLYPPVDGQPVADAVTINKSDTYVTFYINVTNIWDRPCAIGAESFVGLTTIAPAIGHGEPNFFIVKNVSYEGTPSILVDPVFQKIVVDSEESVLLLFACEGNTEEYRDQWRWGSSYPFGTEATTEGSDIQVSLFFEAYKLENGTAIPSGRSYGQTISTQATILLRDS